MPPRNTFQSIVVTANKFPVALLTDGWLSSHNVFQPADLASNFIYTPKFVLVKGPIRLYGSEDRFQLTCEEPGDGSEIADKASAIVGGLQKAPFQSISFTFHWEYEPEDKSVREFCASRFASPMAEKLGADVDFGLLAITAVRDWKLRVTVRPESNKVVGIFHYVIDFSQPVQHELVVTQAAQWNEMRGHAKNLSHSFFTD
jgi:hypothetical protein